jgi:X-X-X-Leu-X-X-Gly heptad repeat protein
VWLSRPIVRLVARAERPGVLLAIGLALCFTLAYVAELIGLAGIVGAFAAGVFLDPYGENVRAHRDEGPLHDLLHPLAGLLVPLFFVLMGLHVDLTALGEPPVLLFGVVLIPCAIAGKLAAGLGVLDAGVSRLTVGIGMIPRGEVGLIFAGIGTTLSLQGVPLLSHGAFSAVVLMVLVTTVVAPLGLRWALPPRQEADRA